jgi:hypothetical protein
MHGREQQTDNAGGGPVATVYSIPTEGRQPYKETGDEKQALLGY